MPGSVDDGAESILAAHLEQVRREERASFHMPGHKGGPGAPGAALELLGAQAFRSDLSELSGFDYLHGASSAIDLAQRRAAQVFDADRSFFLVNGATVGNLASIAAVVGDGDEILVARDSHRSVYAGVALSGARPIYLPPMRNDRLDGFFGIDVNDVDRLLDEHPAIRAVHITSPSYYGLCAPVERAAELAHRRGIPLIVDEAHGTHFQFSRDLPRPALGCGADLVVQSPHKTLGSLTQSSLLHLQGKRIDAERVASFLGYLQSSSPSALLLVSLDSAIAEMAVHGAEYWSRVVSLARDIRAQLGEVDGLWVYGEELHSSPGIFDHDVTKLVVDVDALGTTGFAAGRWLREAHGINPEFSDLRRMVFSVTTGDRPDTGARLARAIKDLATNVHQLNEHPRVTSLWPPRLPSARHTPRASQQMASEVVARQRAIGRVSADMIVPYPPGVPLVVPGEVIDRSVLDTIEQLVAAGARIVGTPDRALQTVRVLRATETHR